MKLATVLCGEPMDAPVTAKPAAVMPVSCGFCPPKLRLPSMLLLNVLCQLSVVCVNPPSFTVWAPHTLVKVSLNCGDSFLTPYIPGGFSKIEACEKSGKVSPPPLLYAGMFSVEVGKTLPYG